MSAQYSVTNLIHSLSSTSDILWFKISIRLLIINNGRNYYQIHNNSFKQFNLHVIHWIVWVGHRPRHDFTMLQTSHRILNTSECWVWEGWSSQQTTSSSVLIAINSYIKCNWWVFNIVDEKGSNSWSWWVVNTKESTWSTLSQVNRFLRSI